MKVGENETQRRVPASFFAAVPGQTLVLTGAAAAARGAHEAGVGLVVTYPGAPITETYEQLAAAENPSRPVTRVVINEHVAFHHAQGFSLAGGRALITMKHVGLNVAADPAHYAGYLGVRGGMVILVGTDPGATCSTGEYDCRFYALHTHLPMLEPTSAGSACDLVRSAFSWSEEDNLPYLVALPAGACYGIETLPAGRVEQPHRGTGFVNSAEYTNVGRRAVVNHRRLLDRVRVVAERAAGRDLLRVHGPGQRTVVITSGVHLERVREALAILGVADRVTVLCPVLTYPIPVPELMRHCADARRIVFVEDLGGFLEITLARPLLDRPRRRTIHGKNLFPPVGPLTFDLVLSGLAQALELPPSRRPRRDPRRPVIDVPEREGTFCPGCPYRGFFHTLIEWLFPPAPTSGGRRPSPGATLPAGPGPVVGGDIGCSSLPPHFSSWLTCMNSGAALAGGVRLASADDRRVVSLMGDSTLLHSGLQTLIELATTDSDQICFILDNHWTAMTGHQTTPATPVTPGGEWRPHLDLETLIRATGVRRLVRLDPAQPDAMRALLAKIGGERGFRVVLVERECQLQRRRRPKRAVGWRVRYTIEPDRCHECGLCYERFSCPAIVKDAAGHLAIDGSLCAECGLCHHLCPNGAVVALETLDRPTSPP